MPSEENLTTFPHKRDSNQTRSNIQGDQDIETDLQQIQKPLSLQLAEVCSAEVQQINNCDMHSPKNQDSDSHETECYKIGVKLGQKCSTDFQSQDINTDLQQIQNCHYKQPDEMCATDIQQNQIHDANLSSILRSDSNSLKTQCFEVDVKTMQNYPMDFQNCQKDLKGSQNDHQLRQSNAESQQNDNQPTDSRKRNSSSDSPKSAGGYYTGLHCNSDSLSSCANSSNDQNSPTDAMDDQSPSADSQLIQNCDTDSQQSQNCQADSLLNQKFDANSQADVAVNPKSEPSDVDRNSNSPLSEKIENCENLDHATERNNMKIIRCSDGNHRIVNSSGSSATEVKSADIDCADSQNQDPKRNRRSIKRKRDVEDSCPVCGLTIRYSDLSNHFTKEVDNLSNIAKNIRKPRLMNNFKQGINNTYVQVKCNRENRLAAKVAKYSKRNETECPVCHLKLTGSEVQVNEHVLTCVGEESDSDIDIVQHGESFDEYEIGNETRIRAISLVPGGYKSLHGDTCNSKPTDDDECDLDVDTDDTFIYGETQYTELDLIHHQYEPLQEELRRAVVSDQTIEPIPIENKKWPLKEIEIRVEERVQEEIARMMKLHEIDESNPEDSKIKQERKLEKNDTDIISCLQEKIKDLEMQKVGKCLICLEPYTKPLVATTCWHVHCEECWLVSMGVKKLCPQCNTIVFPKNLRRIYL